MLIACLCVSSGQDFTRRPRFCEEPFRRQGAKFCRCCHSLQQMTFAGKSADRMELRKHYLFKHLSAGRVESGLRLFTVSYFPL